MSGRLGTSGGGGGAGGGTGGDVGGGVGGGDSIGTPNGDDRAKTALGPAWEVVRKIALVRVVVANDSVPRTSA